MKKANFKRSRVLMASLLCLTGLTSATAWAQDCEVKLGVAGPMSGGAAPWGLAAKAAADFEAAYVNEQGGLQMGNRKCKVKVYPFDSLYTAAGGAAASNYFASEGIRIVAGPIGGPEVTGFRPVAKRHGQINFSNTYMAGVLSPEFPLGFHALQSPVSWGPVLVKAAVAKFKFNNVMIVGANDSGGTDGSKQLAKIYSDQGVKATEEYYQRGTTNFGPIAQRIMNAKPAAVELATMPPADTTQLVKELVEAGYSGILGGLGGAGAPPFITGAGGVEKIKALYWLEIVPINEPGVAKFKADYERIMKQPAPPEHMLPHVLVGSNGDQQMLRAVSAAGTDQDVEKIAAELRKLTPESRYFGKGGWRGKTIYGVNQELAFPVGLGIIENGKRAGVQRVEMPAE
jgi:branched-chain amino acid transport system substrate-binding protein